MFQEGLNAKSPLEHVREDKKKLKLPLLKQENCDTKREREREKERERVRER